MTQGYPAGTVRFCIPDIGIVKRDGTPFKSITSANTLDSDWDCVYDAENSRYVFTNAREFPADEPLAGGFTILWQIKGREAQTDFEYEDNPLFSLRDSTGDDWENTKISPIKFRCETLRDYYSIDLQSSMLGYDDFKDSGLNRAGYITYQYNTTFTLHQRARGQI